MARVLLLSYFFSPDGLSTANLVGELAQELQERGHDLRVIATVPHYNYDPETHARQPLSKRWGGLYYRSTFADIPVWHTSIGRRKERGQGRILTFLIYNVISLLLGLFAVRRCDVVLVVSPPLTSGVIGWLLAKLKRARLIYNVQELYPETYITMGAMRRDSLTARVLFALERFIYRVADALTPIGQAFADVIVRQGVPSDKVYVIPNFVDIDFLQPGSKDNPLAQELGLVDRCVALYAGNIGLSQSFDTLLDAAEQLRDDPEIVFLIVGDGVRRAALEQQISARDLTNVQLLPYQPRSRVPDIYATADIGLVPLMAGTARTTLPSKLYTIMATGRPALVAVDPDSDIVRTIEESGAGVAIPPDDASALVEALRQVRDDPARFRLLGENGRRYAETHHSRQAVGQRYNDLFDLLMK